MGNYARATTDESGRQTIFSDGSLKPEPIGKRKTNPFTVDIKHENGYLGQLLYDGSPYNLLVHYLMEDLGFYANRACRYGKSGITRSIIVDNKDYRANNITIYHARHTHDDT